MMPSTMHEKQPGFCVQCANATTFIFCLLLSTLAFAQQDHDSGNFRFVEVDGHRVRLQIAGPASRAEGTPMVVLEAGLSQSLDVWRNVIPQVAAFAPLVAYDRAGMGGSEWDNKEPTPYHVATRLRKALAQAGVMPPYLLVGYSWGGSLMRYYAGLYPDDVAGIVYLDPGPIITQSPSDELAPFDAVGAGKKGYDAFWTGFARVFDKSSEAVKAEFNAMRKVMELNVNERGIRPAPSVPVIVVLSAKPYPFFLKVDYDQQAHFEADLRHRIRMLQEWALTSPQGTVVISNQTTHAIPREEPGLIVWAIQRIYSGKP